jgi:hypothetical protein
MFVLWDVFWSTSLFQGFQWSIFRSENDIYPPPPPSFWKWHFSPSSDTSFVDSYHGLFVFILPYFAFILPFYFPFFFLFLSHIFSYFFPKWHWLIFPPVEGGGVYFPIYRHLKDLEINCGYSGVHGLVWQASEMLGFGQQPGCPGKDSNNILAAIH